MIILIIKAFFMYYINYFIDRVAQKVGILYS